MGFTDLLLGADTSDLIQMNLWVKCGWLHLQETFYLWKALHKPFCRASPASWHGAYPRLDKHWCRPDFEPTEWTQSKMFFLKQTGTAERAVAERGAGCQNSVFVPDRA